MSPSTAAASVRVPGNALPDTIKWRRATPTRVAAVCVQLGDNVSLRNVQRVIGGSFRDLGPLVSAWKDKKRAGQLVEQPAPEAVLAAGLAQIGESIEATIEGATAEQQRTLQDLRAVVAHLPRNADLRLREQSEKLDRLESTLARQGIAASDIGATLQPLMRVLRDVETALTKPDPERDATLVQLNRTLEALMTRLPEPTDSQAENVRLQERIEQLDRELAQHAASMQTLQTTLTTLARNSDAATDKISQVLTDLPQTLRQAPVSQVDAAINQRLEATVFELTHRAAELAARPDHTQDLLKALGHRDAAAARRQTKQTQQSAMAQDALLARLDALVAAVSARQRRKAPKKSKPARRARATRPHAKAKRAKPTTRPASRRTATRSTRTPARKLPRKAMTSRKPTRKPRKSK